MREARSQYDRFSYKTDEAEIYPSLLVYSCGCWSLAFVTLLIVWALF